jgi:hypothetical protein
MLCNFLFYLTKRLEVVTIQRMPAQFLFLMVISIMSLV